MATFTTLRRVEVLEARLRPAQSIPDEDLPAAIQARFAPHFARGVTLSLSEAGGSSLLSQSR
jgi:hypothetical protein